MLIKICRGIKRTKVILHIPTNQNKKLLIYHCLVGLFEKRKTFRNLLVEKIDKSSFK